MLLSVIHLSSCNDNNIATTPRELETRHTRDITSYTSIAYPKSYQHIPIFSRDTTRATQRNTQYHVLPRLATNTTSQATKMAHIFGFAISYIAFSFFHLIQLALGLAVCGLYGQDLTNARNHHVYQDSKWVFAVVVGALSAVTAVLYFVPFVIRFAFVWIWNLVLFILSIALFGVFGKMYIHENPEGDSGVQRMKNAVWVDLVLALLWLFLAVASFGYWWGHKERHSRYTGRARV